MKSPIHKLLTLLILVCVVALAFYFFSFDRPKNTAHESSAFAEQVWAQFEKSEPINFKKENTIPIVAVQNPKSEIYFFYDFNCDECLPQLEYIKKMSVKNDLDLHLRLYPLSKQCNPHVTTAGETYSCYYGQFLLCAEKQNVKIYDALLNLNRIIAPNKKQDPLRNIQASTKSLNLNEAQLNSCLNDPNWATLKKYVADDHLKNKAINLPLLIVNNKIFTGSHSQTAINYLFQNLMK